MLVTLEWVLAPNHIGSRPFRRLDVAEVQLAKALWRLLHQLLVGQLTGLGHDVSTMPITILMCAVPSWEQPGLQGFRPFRQLVNAALQRISGNKMLYEAHKHLGQEANQGVLIFWTL